MSALLPRRAFLSQLARLPLIGGALQLVGTPSAAAIVSDRRLLLHYATWLANEHAAALIELDRPSIALIEPYAWSAMRVRTPLFWFPSEAESPGANGIEAAAYATRPSTRAAVMFSAAGCEWRI